MSIRNFTSLLFAGALLSGSAYAQDNKLTLAMLAMQQGSLAEAKQHIEDAAKHPETKNSAKMYNYRGQIYVAIAQSTDSTVHTEDAVLIAAESFYKSWMLARETGNNRILKESKEALIPDLAAMAVKYLIEGPYTNEQWDKAIDGFTLMLDIVRADRKKELYNTWKVSDTMMHDYRITAATKANKCDIVKSSFDSLVALNFNDPKIYFYLEECYTISQKDTARGLEVIAKGRERYPNDKNLSNRELQLYMAMGKEDILLDKLNAAISKTPDDFATLFVRGNIYDKKISELERKEDSYSDSVDIYKEKAKYAKTPQLKAQHTRKQTEFQKMKDSLQTEAGKYIDLAEADYRNALKAGKTDSMRADAYFNLGSLILHRTRPIVEKINNTSNVENRKKLETMLNDKYRETIEYMHKYELVHPNDVEALRIQKELYFKLGEKAKYDEYEKKFTDARKLEQGR